MMTERTDGKLEEKMRGKTSFVFMFILWLSQYFNFFPLTYWWIWKLIFPAEAIIAFHSSYYPHGCNLIMIFKTFNGVLHFVSTVKVWDLNNMEKYQHSLFPKQNQRIQKSSSVRRCMFQHVKRSIWSFFKPFHQFEKVTRCLWGRVKISCTYLRL